MNLYIPDDKSIEEVKKDFDFSVLRNYQVFQLNNSIELEKDNLKEIQLSVRKLKKSNDTINGVKIHFGKRSSYAVFIRVHDILGIEEDIPFYMNYKDDLWVLMPNKYKNQKADKAENNKMNCGTQEVMRAAALRLQEIEKEKEKEAFEISFLKNMWPVLLAYLGIVFINLFALVKFNKNRIYNQKSYI